MLRVAGRLRVGKGLAVVQVAARMLLHVSCLVRRFRRCSFGLYNDEGTAGWTVSS